MIQPAQARLSGGCGFLSAFALAFELLDERGERCDLGRIEGELDRLLAAAIARLHELDDDAGGAGRDSGQLEQPLGVFQLAVFELAALGA